MVEMTQQENFERWAGKQEWFPFRKGASWGGTRIEYVLPDGKVVDVYFTDNGRLFRIEDD